MHILHVVGARPNFMKAAPCSSALKVRDGVRQTIVHTGQHYDLECASRTSSFPSWKCRYPDVNLAVGSGSHARNCRSHGALGTSGARK